MQTKLLLITMLVLGGLLAGAYFIPWKNIQWGKIEFAQPQTVTVTGDAKTQQKTQIASFTAGVNSININKDQAVKEVNDKISTIIAAVKKFGVVDADITTQSMNIYQNQESYYDQESQTQRSRPGQWNVSNTIEIKLHDITKASDLASMLASGGATNVYGPNFSLDDTTSTENGLLKNAIDNARAKAETIASASGKKLGGILSVNEGTSYAGPQPMYALSGKGGGGGVPVEPGSQTVTKSVTVVFELQ